MSCALGLVVAGSPQVGAVRGNSSLMFMQEANITAPLYIGGPELPGQLPRTLETSCCRRLITHTPHLGKECYLETGVLFGGKVPALG